MFEDEAIIYKLELRSERVVTIDACDTNFFYSIVITNATDYAINQCSICFMITANLSTGIFYFTLEIEQFLESESEGTIEMDCESDSPTFDPTADPTMEPTALPTTLSPTQSPLEEIIVTEANNTFNSSFVPIIVTDEEPKIGIWVWVVIGIAGCCCIAFGLFLVINKMRRKEEEQAICTEDIKLEDVNRESRSYSHSDDEVDNSELQRFMDAPVVVDEHDYQCE